MNSNRYVNNMTSLSSFNNFSPKKKPHEITYNEDIYLLETILSHFIPFFELITKCSAENSFQNLQQIFDELILYTNYPNKGSKSSKKNLKRNFTNSINSDFLKLEEKEFLYKTYLSSSHSEQVPNQSIKILYDNTIQIFSVNSQLIRSLLILIKEELSELGDCEKILLNKLSKVRKIVIYESKTSDSNLLAILLLFIIKNFCANIDEIIFEGTFCNRIDQIDVMIKNGIYLHFMYILRKISKISLVSRIEFINENIAFKILYDYCSKMKITEIQPDQIMINQISIFNIIRLKNNIKALTINKVNLDKTICIETIIDIIQNNKFLNQLLIDKYMSIPDVFRNKMVNSLIRHKYIKFIKIDIISSNLEDLDFLQIPKENQNLQRFQLKLRRLSLENSNLSNKNTQLLLDLTNTNLIKLSLFFERIVIFDIRSLINKNLKELSLGQMNSETFKAFSKSIVDENVRLNKLKISFLPISDEQYEEVYSDALYLLESCNYPEYKFVNFLLKYKNICSDELKSIVTENKILKKLTFAGSYPYRIHYFEGLYYNEIPKKYIYLLLNIVRNNKCMTKIKKKKPILNKILDFFKVKKEKFIRIAYKV